MAAICLLFTINSQAAPKAEISESTFDFGFAPQGSKLSHKYWIHATGTEDLKITKVVPGCGCTKAPPEKDIVAVGDSTWLEIIFSSKKYTSKITKRPKFYTNEGKAAKKVSFTAHIVSPNDVTSPLVINPFKVNLSKQSDFHLANSKINTNEDNNGMVEVTNNSDTDLSIKIVDIDTANFNVDLPQLIHAGETVQGTIYLQNVKSEKSFQKSLTIEVNDEKKTRFTIPVTYNSQIISHK